MIFDIYTDGSCSGNPGPAGWGYLVICEGKIVYEKFGATTNEHEDVVYCTNQQSEMMALEKALRLMVQRFNSGKPNPEEIKIYSDSAYLLNCFIKKWYVNWKKYANNGIWLTSQKSPVCNQWLWNKMINQTIFLEQLGVKFTYIKVKGHSGNPHNERADQLANLGTQLAQQILQPKMNI